MYCNYLAIPYLFSYKTGFPLSRMTTNNYICPMKFCYNIQFTLPKQSQRPWSDLQDRARCLELFWKGKKQTLSYNQRNTVGQGISYQNDPK